MYYILNNVPSKSVDKTPYEIYTRYKPTLYTFESRAVQLISSICKQTSLDLGLTGASLLDILKNQRGITSTYLKDKIV